MTDSERIKELKNYSGLSYKKLADRLKLKTPQTLYDIEKGKHGISKNLADKIQAEYLDINPVWLLTGEGEMLSGTVIQQNNQNGDNIQGASVTINKQEGDYLEIIKNLTSQLSKSQEQISKSQEQMDRLITIIENKL